jgi:menaquinone-9 beta-reductase
VGADGVNGVVRHAIAPRGQSGLARLLEARAEQPADEILSTQVTRSCATLDFSCMSKGVQGYAWDFPAQFGHSAGHSVGIFDSRVSPGPVSGSLGPFLQQFTRSRGVDSDCLQVEGWPLRSFRRDGLFSVSRVLLAGDAAGVDPLLGEGISFALGYGDVAARELADAFKREDFSFRHYRRHVLTHRVGRDLIRRSRVASLIYRIHKEWLLRFLWWTFGPIIGKLAEGFLVDWGE